MRLNTALAVTKGGERAMRYLCIFALAIAASGSGHAAGQDHDSITGCASLLPKGKTYSFKVEGTVDTATTLRVKANTHVKGSVHGEAGQTEAAEKAFEKEITAFQNCMNNLVGK